MPHNDAYALHLWRSRAARGRQWAARLDHLPDGASRRFTVLLAHLEALVQTGERAEPPADPAAGADGPTRSAQEGGAVEGM